MGGREPFPQREKRERKKETESATLSSHKMNISLEHGLGAGFLSVTGFLQTVCGAQTRLWKCMTFARIELWNAILGRRRALAPESTILCRDFLGHTRREHSPSCSTFVLSKDKRPCRYQQTAFHQQGTEACAEDDNLVAAFPYATPKILHAVQAWDCFSGTKHTRQSTASFYTGRGVGGPCSARSFKM